MKKPSRFIALVCTCTCVVFLTLTSLPAGSFHAAARQGGKSGSDAREEAYRANNLGVALLEQFKHKEGAEEFRRALRLDPKLTLARINLAIALFNVPDVAGAQREAQAAAAAAPDAPQPAYVLGLIAKQQSRVEDAVAAFQRVLKIDPRDVGANVNLGQLYAQQRKYPEAVAAFRTALEEEPYNGTALYNLGTALLRSNQREEGQRMMQQFQVLRQSGAATIIGQNYLEQGRYAEAVSSTGAEAELVDKRPPAVAFTDATAGVIPVAQNAGATPAAQSPAEQVSGAVALFDIDGDDDLDLIEVSRAGQRLYRNDGGKFTDVTAQAGAFARAAGGTPTAVVAGDFDNDEKADIFVLRYGAASTLYRNEGGGRFGDVTAAAKIPAYNYLSNSVAFVDADHDGDLDIFIAGRADASKGNAANWPAAPSLLLRNNGDGTFADQTAAAKLAGAGVAAVAVVPTDYDNRRDVDLLVAGGGGTALWRNLRDGTFRNVAAEVGLGGSNKPVTSVAAGDVNKDGFTDFYFGHGTAPGEFALSDGKGHFQLKAGPAVASTEVNQAAQFLDYDNDGLLDLLTVAASAKETSLRVWRNTGDGWADVSETAARTLKGEGAAAKTGQRVLAAGDIDGDGDADLIFGTPGGDLKFARNDGGNHNASVHVRLKGKVSNRSGIGAKVEVRAGSLQQKLETYSASPAPAPSDVTFGLGRRASVDAVRVLWPAGIVQAETEITAAKPTTARAGDAKAASFIVSTTVTELDRKPSSCPYLYAWNGERFEFITDFMGGGELGYWVAPGIRSAPDSDEYVRIRGDQLRERNGRYELRVTNELEEVLYMDRLRLIAVAHPVGVEVYPNEGLGNPTSAAFKLYATRGARPPVAAQDEHGHDMLARIEKNDRQYPDDFKLHRIRGYAEEHALVLDLGKEARQGGAQGRVLLLMNGWTDYAFSSDNVAASQSGMSLKPPALQVKDGRGQWRTVIEDIGIPVGRPQTVAVDLTGKFLSESREVRILTNMRIYWDQILVDTTRGDFPVRMEPLDPMVADLRWRGFSAELTPDGREPFGYDYTRVTHTSPWKLMPGRYTREGDVRELLSGVDDMFVISRPGDEVTLSFDAAKLGPLPANWTRTFLLYADGFSKEMDINSASPDQVAPLPFHGMKNYPYAAPEAFPATPAHQAYMERYNTRIVAAPLSRIEAGYLPPLEADR